MVDIDIMKILFDFDIFGDPELDTHLLDILLVFKRGIIEITKPFDKEILMDGGHIIVTFKPNEQFSIAYIYKDNINLANTLLPICNNFDYEKAIRSIVNTDLN